MAESEKYSFKGWQFKTWLSKNKDSLRLILSGVAGLLTGFASGLDPAWSTLLGTLVAGLSKMALDSFDYYLSE